MLAVTALQLDVFSHLHWQLDDLITGAKLAAPCVAVDAALLTLYTALSPPAQQQQQQQKQQQQPNPAAAPLSIQQQQSSPQIDQAQSLLVSAMDVVYLHNIRYSLLGAAAPAQRLALEAGAQASEELLARGALLGCASGWLANRCVRTSVRVCVYVWCVGSLQCVGWQTGVCMCAHVCVWCWEVSAWLANRCVCM